MSIIYDPKAMLKKIAPKRKIEKLLSKKVELKKTALSFIDAVDFLDKKSVSEVALKTIRSYQERIAKAQVDAGFDKSAGKAVADDLIDDPRLLIARVENEVVFQIAESIRENYDGEKYIWLPSDAQEPDPEHQLNYGKVFTIGEGEMPGDRIGCRCGMEILTNETKLSLE